MNLYQHLPYSLKVLAESAKGVYIQWQRSDRHFEEQVEAAFERERWTLSKWQSWQEEMLALALERAATRVPYYREMWRVRRQRGDRASWDYLENWPVLHPASVLRQPEAFVADDLPRGVLFRQWNATSSGEPFIRWVSREELAVWHALTEARQRRWFGVKEHDRQAEIGASPRFASRATRPPFWVWNRPLNRLSLSGLRLNSEVLPDYLEAMRRYQVKYLFGYPSSIVRLARYLNVRGERMNMKAVITHTERLYDFQREAI